MTNEQIYSILGQGLNIANTKGCFNLDESATIAQALFQLKENTDTVQSNCKLFGKKVDAVFQEISDYSNNYLLFLAEDANGAKQYVPQMYLATKGTIMSVGHPWASYK